MDYNDDRVTYEEMKEADEHEQAWYLIKLVQARIINLRADAIDAGNDSLVKKLNTMFDQIDEDYKRYATDDEYRHTILQNYPEILNNLGI